MVVLAGIKEVVLAGIRVVVLVGIRALVVLGGTRVVELAQAGIKVVLVDQDGIKVVVLAGIRPMDLVVDQRYQVNILLLNSLTASIRGSGYKFVVLEHCSQNGAVIQDPG